MPQREQYVNKKTTSLAAAMTALDTTLTPASYTGFPASGQGDVTIQKPVLNGEPTALEVVTVTDFATHPWPVVRGQAGTVAVSHEAGVSEVTGTTFTVRQIAALTDAPRAAAALYLAATCI